MSSRLYDMSYPQYTVHDVSALTGLTPQTIRYYDGIGVVVPRRGAQGQRLYSYYDVLNLVRRSLYKAQGFSLQETEQVLSGAITSRLGALLEEKRADIEEKQRALRPLYDFVAQQNLTPEGMIYGRDIVNDVSDGVTLRYYEAWLPVRESEG